MTAYFTRLPFGHARHDAHALLSSPPPHMRCRYHQYKFIVDGEWRHDETQPFMPDPLGNVNNWLFVRKPEGAGQACAFWLHCFSTDHDCATALNLHPTNYTSAVNFTVRQYNCI